MTLCAAAAFIVAAACGDARASGGSHGATATPPAASTAAAAHAGAGHGAGAQAGSSSTPAAHRVASEVTPDEAFKELVVGNGRFVTGTPSHANQDAARRAALTGGQKPHAIILSCSDSRVPPEVVFDRGLGEIFVVRVAGNVLSDVATASIEYAVEHLGAPLIVVMGHESCGAVKAALTLKAEDAGSFDLTSLVASIQQNLAMPHDDAGDDAHADGDGKSGEKGASKSKKKDAKKHGDDHNGAEANGKDDANGANGMNGANGDDGHGDTHAADRAAANALMAAADPTLEEPVKANVDAVVAHLMKRSIIVRHAIDDGHIEIVPAIYHLSSGEVEFWNEPWTRPAKKAETAIAKKSAKH